MAVVLGAFGAHGLEGVLSEESLQSYRIATRYQLIHSVLLIALGMSPLIRKISISVSVCFTAGIILFSGSIYVLTVFEGLGWLGPVTPIGGGLLIFGWIQLTIWGARQWNGD